MGISRTKTLLALLAVWVFAPVQAEAQTILSGSYTGGSNFATGFSTNLVFNAITGEIQLDITNTGGGEIFKEIGLVNIPSLWSSLPTTTVSVWGVSAGGDWQWGLNSLHDDGLAPGTQGYRVKPPPPKRGLDVGETTSFTFGVNTFAFADVANVGVAVHAISGPGDCSTKFGVWNGGAASNDGGTSGSYDVACGGGGPPTVVPEPGTTLLLATGFVGLALVARRRRGILQRDE